MSIVERPVADTQALKCPCPAGNEAGTDCLPATLTSSCGELLKVALKVPLRNEKVPTEK